MGEKTPQSAVTAVQPPLELWYKKAAPDSDKGWEEYGLPLNGYLDAAEKPFDILLKDILRTIKRCFAAFTLT